MSRRSVGRDVARGLSELVGKAGLAGLLGWVLAGPLADHWFRAQGVLPSRTHPSIWFNALARCPACSADTPRCATACILPFS